MNDEIHKVPLVQKQIEEFGKKFASKFNIAYVRHKGFAFLGREILNFTAEYFLEQLTLAEKRGEEKARKEIAHKLEDESWTMNGHTVVCMSDVWNIARRQSQEREEK